MIIERPNLLRTRSALIAFSRNNEAVLMRLKDRSRLEEVQYYRKSLREIARFSCFAFLILSASLLFFFIAS